MLADMAQTVRLPDRYILRGFNEVKYLAWLP